MKLIINTSCEKALSAIINNLPQSLLVYGPEGVGLGTIAQNIALQCGVKPTLLLPEKDEAIDLDKGVISIDIIRRIYDEVRTKTTSKRIIIIDYAERMTIQAQNSFLKLLEEPSDNVYFILVSHSYTKLLPTILSRAEKLEIKPVSLRQSEKLLDDLDVTDKTKRSQLLFMAEGLPAEIIRLNLDEALFANRSLIIKDARELLRGSLYQKLLIAHNYKDNRVGSLKLLTDVLTILRKSINDNPQANSIRRIDSVIEAYQHIESNGSIRLCLARMII